MSLHTFEWELLCILCDIIKWCRHCGINLTAPQNYSIEFAFNPVIPLMKIHTEQVNAGNEIDTLTPAFIQNSQIVKVTQLYINWWMDK